MFAKRVGVNAYIKNFQNYKKNEVNQRKLWPGDLPTDIKNVSITLIKLIFQQN